MESAFSAFSDIIFPTGARAAKPWLSVPERDEQGIRRQSHLPSETAPATDKGVDPFVAGAMGAPGWMLKRLGIRNVIADLTRQKYADDTAEAKIAFLKSDPVTSLMSAVKHDRIVVMDAHAMDPTMSTFDGLSQLADAVAHAE